jgi:hypothetical protein
MKLFRSRAFKSTFGKSREICIWISLLFMPVSISYAQHSTTGRQAQDEQNTFKKTNLPADGNGTGGITITGVHENVFVDISGQVRITSTGFLYSRESKLYSGTLTITNNGPDISAPIGVALCNLTPGVMLANLVDMFQGNPYITVTTKGLATGASVTVPIQFNNPVNAQIKFTPMPYRE